MLNKSYFCQYLQNITPMKDLKPFSTVTCWWHVIIWLTIVKNMFEDYPAELRGKYKEGDTAEHYAQKNKIPPLKSHLWAATVSLNTCNTVREVEYSCYHEIWTS